MVIEWHKMEECRLLSCEGVLHLSVPSGTFPCPSNPSSFATLISCHFTPFGFSNLSFFPRQMFLGEKLGDPNFKNPIIRRGEKTGDRVK
jgi:hypothetical protein